MANTAQTRKRVRQSAKQRLHNAGFRSTMRTAVKNVLKAVAVGDKAKADEAYKVAVPVIDRTARKGLIHLNKASRHKSRLLRHVRAMSA